jgi:lipopolysaccharide transport system permease protein
MFSILLFYFRPDGTYWLYLICLPLALLITLFTSMGIGTFLSAINVKYRDFRYILPFLIQALFFFTPVVYTEQAAGKELGFYKYIQMINPMSVAVKLMRLPLTHEPFDMNSVCVGVAMSVLLFLVGIFIFRKTEAQFADLA